MLSNAVYQSSGMLSGPTLSAWGSLHGLYSQPQIHWGALYVMQCSGLHSREVLCSEMRIVCYTAVQCTWTLFLAPGWTQNAPQLVCSHRPLQWIVQRENKSGYTAGWQILYFPKLFWVQGTSLISIYIFFYFLYELKIYLITLTKIVQILG